MKRPEEMREQIESRIADYERQIREIVAKKFDRWYTDARVDFDNVGRGQIIELQAKIESCRPFLDPIDELERKQPDLDRAIAESAALVEQRRIVEHNRNVARDVEYAQQYARVVETGRLPDVQWMADSLLKRGDHVAEAARRLSSTHARLHAALANADTDDANRTAITALLAIDNTTDNSDEWPEADAAVVVEQPKPRTRRNEQQRSA